VYNVGESTKHIDWKLFARTDRLYTKRFEEETNLRCHIIDNSSSMHYPKVKKIKIFTKIRLLRFGVSSFNESIKEAGCNRVECFFRYL
jgi:uncharacterized protein (DUF58 family)